MNLHWDRKTLIVPEEDRAKLGEKRSPGMVPDGESKEIEIW